MRRAIGYKEPTVEKISASRFQVCEGTSMAGEEEEERKTFGAVQRESVIRKAPPARKEPKEDVEKKEGPEGAPTPAGVILIKDAIMYRIVDILMWKVAGERRLRGAGYPSASTCQLLWRLARHGPSAQEPGKAAVDHLPQDHDCGGNVACFSSHICRFLDVFAPQLWWRGCEKLSVEDFLRRIYHKDLIPYLRSLDHRNNIYVLQCHSDIVLLEKWEKQKFTAVTWSGQKQFFRPPVCWPKCPQCNNRHF